MSNNGGIVSLGWHGDKVIAALLCVRFGDRCYALFAGSDDQAVSLRPMEALYWSTMQWAKHQGCVEYDMQWAPIDFPPTRDQPGYGLYHFKEGFGAEFRYYAGAFDLIGDKWLYRACRCMETIAGGVLHRIVNRLRLRRYRAGRSMSSSAGHST